ncbi:MAG TPA: DUF2971 domain-containing protein [Lacunisphaera sp.]|jgi:hypothetical protein
MTLSPNHLHDRTSFFKYLSASTAKLVLENNSLRWSSPRLFNDPFDVPRELSFGITAVEMSEAYRRRLVSLIQHPPDETSELSPQVRLIVDTVKQGITPELRAEMIAALNEPLQAQQTTDASMDELRDLWRGWIPDFRILCLTESPAHSAMWFHYADQYKGAVLEFNCNDDSDSAWRIAQPVTYPATKPDVFEADGWAKLMMMPIKRAIETMFHVSTYTKSPDWSYENEWRITSFKRPDDTGLFTDYKFAPRDLSAIYLGPLISPVDKASLLAVAAKYPHVRISEVAIGMTRTFLFKKYG